MSPRVKFVIFKKNYVLHFFLFFIEKKKEKKIQNHSTNDTIWLGHVIVVEIKSVFFLYTHKYKNYYV